MAMTVGELRAALEDVDEQLGVWTFEADPGQVVRVEVMHDDAGDFVVLHVDR